MPRLVIISDTHTYHHDLAIPDGDVLIHCGDLCGHGALQELQDFLKWFASQPHHHKCFIAGNHDLCLDPSHCPREAPIAQRMVHNAGAGIHYLQDSGVTIESLRFWGSPYQPDFYDWAFQEPRGLLAQRWRRIPDDTDVLITHGPPYGKGDLAPIGGRVGCEALLDRVNVVKPLLHCFGHIHEGHGMGRLWVDGAGNEGWWCNAAVLDGQYRVAHKPTVIDIEPRKAAA